MLRFWLSCIDHFKGSHDNTYGMATTDSISGALNNI